MADGPRGCREDLVARRVEADRVDVIANAPAWVVEVGDVRLVVQPSFAAYPASAAEVVA